VVTIGQLELFEGVSAMTTTLERRTTALDQTPVIGISSAIDRERAAAVITRAFAADPICRWFIVDEARYQTFFPPFVRAFGGAAFDHGTADVADDFAGVALWLPPGAKPDEDEMGGIAVQAIPPDEQEERFALIEQQSAMHPTFPHWYLPLIGVDVTQQGRGYGSALLRYALERADADGVPAYLEATTRQNRKLYERHGFEPIGVIQHGSSPPMWPMIRKPR
jgi:GNAT superfamily N-acetyltransferase